MIAALGGLLLLAATDLSSDVSVSEVEIRSSFDGTELLVFGAVNLAADPARPITLVVDVTGPPVAATVRRKGRVAGIWANRSAAVFDRVPGFHFVTGTHPLDQIASDDALAALGLLPAKWPELGEDRTAPGFAEAFIRLRVQEGLYGAETGQVLLREDGLFRTTIMLPSNVPTGRYTVRSLLFAGGQRVAEDEAGFSVRKAGFERLVYRFAHDWPLLYGLAAVVFAFGVGGLAAILFGGRR